MSCLRNYVDLLTWESNSIARPATSVLEEKVCLGCTGRGSRLSEVVATADESGVGSTYVVLAELGILVGGSLSGLQHIR